MKQTTTFTLLPQAVAGEATLRLAVHVGLRLEPDGPDGLLSEFDDARNWADTALGFSVSFDGGAPIAATVVTDPAKDPPLWHALFDGDATVKGKPFPPYATLPVLSFPTASVLDFVEQTYTQVAVGSPTEHPLVAALFPLFEQIAFTERESGIVAELLQSLENERTNGNKRFNHFESGPSATTQHHFVALKRFYQRPGEIVELEQPRFDFHEVLALVNQHPPLARMLGLVFDLEVSARILGGLPAQGDVQLHVDWTPLDATTAIVRPKTRYELDYATSHFATRPRDPGELQRRHLRLGDGSRFRLVTTDPDGAGLKVLNFASSLKRLHLEDNAGNDEFPARQATVPSLRSAGLSVIRRERASKLVPKLDIAVATNNAIVDFANDDSKPPPDVWLEDVTTGYTVDVWDSRSQAWHSVVRREGSYDFPSIEQSVPVPAGDEATVVSAPTLPADPAADQELYLGQSLFQWLGWSLAVEAPGLAIHRNDEVTPPADDPPAEPAVPLGFTFDVPAGSLPRLRYGTEYRVRMRAVDITGGRVPFADGAGATDASLVTGRRYLRWEPIPSPVLALVEPRTEAEAVDHVVIRSDYVGPIEAPSKRHVVPPKGAAQTAEEHGKFDVGSPSLVDGTAYPFITSREAKSLLDVPGATVDPDDPGGDEAQTVYVPNDFELPWLPDPLVAGAAFRNLPGGQAPPDPDAYDFPPGPTASWHDLRPFRLVAVAPSAGGGLGPAAAPVFDANARTLTVEVPKAWIVRVPVSAAPVGGALDVHGIWDWIANASPPNLAALRAAASKGAHWMLEPYRVLTLVHAVRRPLKTPEFTAPSALRLLGQTFALINDRMKFSRRSTGKVDVYGRWDEWIDSGPDAPPAEDPTMPTSVETLAFQPPLAQPGETPEPDDDTLEVHSPHEFGDTKHRVVTYRAVATTKFTEYFVERQKHTAGGGSIQLVTPPDAVIPESLKVRDRTTGQVYALGDDYVLNPAGDSILPTGIPNGTLLEVTFLVPPLTRETTGPEEDRVVNVLSSARPAAPKVLYAVPTFAHPESSPLSSSRARSGIRVYLERPWWSSGGGELLGVTLWVPQAFQSDPIDRLVPYVTRWGLDPLFAGGSLPARNPSYVHFPLAVRQGVGLTLDELAGQTVNVAGHEVGFDPERNLWYCDIDVDIASAYTPFVRLALVRYQPDSLPNAHISRVVLADYMQIEPGRAVTVVKQLVIGRGNPKVTVTVNGLSYMQSEAEFGPGFAHAIVEQRDPARGTAEELGWKQVGDPVPLAPLPTANPIVGIWTGTVTIPGALTPGAFRIVVEQFEILQTGTFFLSKLKGKRLVYSDVVPL